MTVFASFLDGALAGYGIAVPVGAIAVLIVAVGIAHGFRAAFAAGAGAATADLVYAAVAAVAGSAVSEALGPQRAAIRWISAAVLTALAVRGFLAARRSEPGTLPTIGGGRPARTYATFVALTLVNPLTVVYFTTLVVGLGSRIADTAAAGAAFVLGAFAASLSWQTALAGVGAVARHRLPARFRLATVTAGNLVVLALAVRIVVAG